jgi:hypothetical protein
MKTYLGDGLYAEFDNKLCLIILTAEGSMGKNKVYLESESFENLLNFFEKISNKKVTITDK